MAVAPRVETLVGEVAPTVAGGEYGEAARDVSLDNAGPGAVARRCDRSGEPGRAAADHGDVVGFGHGASRYRSAAYWVSEPSSASAALASL